MWLFPKKNAKTEIKANSVDVIDGQAIIDIRGQTCPGYLLAINRAVDQLNKGMNAKLLITYPPCGADVKAWCKEKEIQYLGISQDEGMWIIRIMK